MSRASKKTVSKKSYVDETLFGNLNLNAPHSSLTVAGNKQSNGPKSQAGAAVLSKEELRGIRAKCEDGKQSDAIVLSQNEIDRIKGSTKIQTKEQEVQ